MTGKGSHIHLSRCITSRLVLIEIYAYYFAEMSGQRFADIDRHSHRFEILDWFKQLVFWHFINHEFKEQAVCKAFGSGSQCLGTRFSVIRGTWLTSSCRSSMVIKSFWTNTNIIFNLPSHLFFFFFFFWKFGFFAAVTPWRLIFAEWCTDVVHQGWLWVMNWMRDSVSYLWCTMKVLWMTSAIFSAHAMNRTR